MTPNELHDYLLGLKNKNAQDPNIAEYKSQIRQELNNYRTNQPDQYMLHSRSSLHKEDPPKDIVFYSFMEAPGRPKIGEHEYKRLKLSWSSLRKYNTDIEIRDSNNRG